MEAPGGRLGLVAILWIATLVALTAAVPPARSGETLDGHGGPVSAIAVSGTRALTASFDYALIDWSLTPEPRARSRLIGHDAAVNAAAFVPGAGRAVSGGDDGAVMLWDLPAGTLSARLEGHRGRVVDIAVSPDGRHAASAGWDRTARLWNLADATPAAVLEGHRDHVNAVAFSADGETLYTAGADGTIRTWRVGDGAPLRTVHEHGWGVNAIAPLPGGGGLAFATTDGAVAVLDPQTGAVTHRFEASEQPVLALAVSAEPARLAAAGADGSIRVWSLSDRRLLTHDRQPYGPVLALAFADDGLSLYHGGMDDRAFRWDLDDGPAARPSAPAATASADAGPGERAFERHCAVCHTLTPAGGNRAGPTLYRLFGRRAGSLPHYPYSPALRESDMVWTEETVNELFADGPHEVVPGSKMPLQRMNDAAARRALVSFLKRATMAGSGASPSRRPAPQGTLEKSRSGE